MHLLCYNARNSEPAAPDHPQIAGTTMSPLASLLPGPPPRRRTPRAGPSHPSGLLPTAVRLCEVSSHTRSIGRRHPRFGAQAYRVEPSLLVGSPATGCVRCSLLESAGQQELLDVRLRVLEDFAQHELLVTTQRRRHALDPGGWARQREARVLYVGRAVDRVLELDEVPTVRELRVRSQVRGVRCAMYRDPGVL